MKTISESILENNLYDILKDHLLYHIKISEYILNPFVYESLGTFNQAGKVAEYIFDDIRKNGFKDKITYNCKKFKTYFDDVELICHNSSEIYGNYNGQENRKINIELYIPEKISYENYDDFMFIFIHELMHGYEDKRRIKHGKPSIFNLLDDNYMN